MQCTMDLFAFINSKRIFYMKRRFIMDKTVSNLYEFHFKIDSEMKSKLMGLHMFKTTGSLSRLVVQALTLLSPRIERSHLSREQKDSQYEFVNENKEIERESVHVYLPEYLYRKLKLIHHDLNYYSIAQLLRLILRVFLGLARRYGRMLQSKLIAAYKRWKAKSERRKYKYIPIRQLLHFIFQKPRISRHLTLYSNKYAPIDIFRL
jgi:hypothetical protein